jgi:laccase
MATTTRGPVTMRLCFFSAAALFLLCFLLPAAVAEERFYEFVVRDDLVLALR